MRKQLKGLLTLGMVACLSVLGGMYAFAGEWKEDKNGKWYQNDDGSYPVDKWKEIDGAYYYFDNKGYNLRRCTYGGFLLGIDGAWIPEANPVEGKVIASAIVEDMGLTFGELKVKYGGYDMNRIQKLLLYDNGGAFEYDDVNLVSKHDLEFIQALVDDSISNGAQYGTSVIFPNSLFQVIMKATNEFVETRHVPNYRFHSDSNGNISDDSKPIAITVQAKTLFPDLTPLYKMDEMVEKAEAMGASNIVLKSEILTNSDMKERESFYDFKFELGGCLFEPENMMFDKVGLDCEIKVTKIH